MTRIDVLVVGAGPTGLVLALWLTKQGISVRIIDKALQAANSTRALAVQARILELYSQLDLTDTVLKRGLRNRGFNAWVKGRKAFRVPVDAIGSGMTAYPFIEVFPQHEHEQMLIDKLKEFGVSVELHTDLTSFNDDSDSGHVIAYLRKPDGAEERCEARYIAGCDGARSTVRETLGLRFSGGTYDQVFYVADIEGAGPPVDGELHICLDDADFLAVFPLAGKGAARVIGTVRQSHRSPEEVGRGLTFDDVRGRAIEQMKLEVVKVNWFSPHHVHHRVADHFRKGRAFLLGDAAHVHSPAGGQGMNTGIGDAINLAWKLAAVIRGTAEDNLLDTYEEERIHFAQRLVSTTDRAFSMATAEGWFARLLRTRVVPVIAPFLLSFRAFRKYIFRTISQITLNYRSMTLSVGETSGVKGGERLPWVEVNGASNFDSLSQIRWQIHVYGTASDALSSWCKRHDVPLTVLGWSVEYGSVGLVRDALYLMRPDTYVALIEPKGRVDVIETYFRDRQIRLK